MITKLTEEQKAKIPIYLDKWLKQGLSTEQLKFEDVKIAVDKLYSIFLKDYSKNVFTVLVDSPFQALFANIILQNLFKNIKDSSQLDSRLRSQLYSPLDSQLRSQLRSQLDSQLDLQLDSQSGSPLCSPLDSQLYSQLYSQLRSQLYSQVDSQGDSLLGSQLDSQFRSQLYSQLNSQLNFQLYSQLGSQLDSRLDSQLDSPLDSQLYSQLYSQLRSQLYSQVDSQGDSLLGSQLDSRLRSQLRSQLKNIFCSTISFKYWWSSYYGFYDFINKELLPNVKIANFDEVMDIVGKLPMIFVHSHFCIVTNNPTEIHRKNTVLHNEKGLAIKYKDNWGVYALNGIRVDKKYIEAKAEDISVQDLMKEQNVDVRREVLRKVGLERFIKETKGKCLDKMTITINNKICEYQLLEIKFGDNIVARVLKMDNPSIDAMHVEGVEDTCNTVKEALAWRNGYSTYVEPKQLT